MDINFRLLLRPVLVDGAVDNTAGTLTAPDLDVNIEQDLEEELAKYLVINPLDNGESGQYEIYVERKEKLAFKTRFKRFIIDIQNHGKDIIFDYIRYRVEDAYIEEDDKIFLSSDLLRKQVGGFYQLMKDGKSFALFKEKDFSATGAARTFELDIRKWFNESLKPCLYLDFIPGNLKELLSK